MEVEVSELIGAERGERTPGPRDPPQRLSPAALGHARRRDRAADPEAAPWQLLPDASWQPRKRSEQALVAVVQQAYVCGVSTRRVDQLVESLGLRVSRSEVSRICAGLDEQVEAFRQRPLEGRYPYLFVDAKVEKVRAGGRVVRKCVVIAHGVHESGRREIDRARRRRGRDRGLLARVPARAGGARPGRRAARDLRRPPRPQGGARAGARLPLAALHGALPQGLPRPRPQGPARRCSAR